ncbi:hypothetical protein J4417_04940 [Candidatus Woesearchaeota archaeon]|nr:hypothetical protein [Candidatus Woesearchaeota archaeon]
MGNKKLYFGRGMSKVLIFVIVLLIFSFSAYAQTNHYYKINLAYQNGDLSATSVKIEPSLNEIKNPKGKYVAEVVSFDNKILNLTFFDIPLFVFWDSVDPETGKIVGGGMFERNKTNITLFIPYYGNGQEINIYDKELNKKLSISISSYAKEIPSIKLKTEMKEEKISEEKKVSMIATEKSNPSVVYYSLGGGIFILILLGMFLSKRKTKTAGNN